MAFADCWVDPGDDACVTFFSQCLARARFDIPPGARILELGCAEYPWMRHVRRVCPDLEVTGIDWRETEDGQQGDILTVDFPLASFAAIIAISTIEHIGLGHYRSDPIDPEGDTTALARAWRWLRPGGVLFFDVPFDPTGYRVQGTKCRVYDRATLRERLQDAPLRAAETTAVWAWEGYARATDTAHVQTAIPTEPVDPFWYVGLVGRKV